ncbi:reverse transcriptase domain-containing protein [Tanacetum coccineum]
MTTPVEKRNASIFCEFHGEVGHNRDECMHLRKQIKEILKAGKLSHLIKELKQNNGKEQPKVTKKGETSGKDKVLAILMVQPWEKVARQRITQSFSPNTEISFPPLDEDEGTEGPMIIEAEIGGHCIHLMYVDGRSASEIVLEGPYQYLPNTGGTDQLVAITLEYPNNSNDQLHPHRGRPQQVMWTTPAQLGHFSWKSADMTSVPRHIVKHRLNRDPVTLHFIESNTKSEEENKKEKEGMFLGYKVNAKGLKVCPDKVDPMLSLPSPKCLKDVQKLNEKLASLNRFLAKSVEKSLPFFKTLKKCTKKSDFHWTTEAKEAFRQMKQLIAELPMLTAPTEKEELIVYLAVAKEAVSAVLMTEREAKQMPIYFVSGVLRGPELNYTSMEKLVMALVHASKRLKRPRVLVKGQILADFIVERPEEDSLDTPMEEEGELPEPWILFTDGSSCTDGS